MARVDELATRIERLERIAAILASERFGIQGGLGPIDISFRQQRSRATADTMQILRELAEVAKREAAECELAEAAARLAEAQKAAGEAA